MLLKTSLQVKFWFIAEAFVFFFYVCIFACVGRASVVALASHSPSLTVREPGARPWTQWAAVSTTLTDTRLPPQMKPPVSLSAEIEVRQNQFRLLYTLPRMAAIQGNSPKLVTWDPVAVAVILMLIGTDLIVTMSYSAVLVTVTYLMASGLGTPQSV